MAYFQRRLLTATTDPSTKPVVTIKENDSRRAGLIESSNQSHQKTREAFNDNSLMLFFIIIMDYAGHVYESEGVQSNRLRGSVALLTAKSLTPP